MILTTTDKVDGYEVKQYLGIVSGMETYGVGGITGLGVVMQDQSFRFAFEKAQTKMSQSAQSKGADAVIGIQTVIAAYEALGDINVAVTGTAVKLVKSGWDEELPDL